MKHRTHHKNRELVEGFLCQEHPLYPVWAGMLGRCFNPNSNSYKNYGGRGITVCERWHHFANFVADMGKRPEGMTLERIRNSEGYKKSNCKWGTRSEQCFNRRKFSNNKSGGTGIVANGNRFHVRFDYEGVRYSIGRVDTITEGVVLRNKFIRLFFKDRGKAIASISGETLWSTSTTRQRGVTPHVDGGFIVRKTVGGVRHYVGYFKTIREACRARDNFAA